MPKTTDVFTASLPVHDLLNILAISSYETFKRYCERTLQLNIIRYNKDTVNALGYNNETRPYFFNRIMDPATLFRSKIIAVGFMY